MAEPIRPRSEIYWIAGIAVVLLLAAALVVIFGLVDAPEVACVLPRLGQLNWPGTLIVAEGSHFTLLTQAGEVWAVPDLPPGQELVMWSALLAPDGRRLAAYMRDTLAGRFAIDDVAVLSWDGLQDAVWPIGGRLLGGWLDADTLLLSDELSAERPDVPFATQALDVRSGAMAYALPQWPPEMPPPLLERSPLWTVLHERYSPDRHHVFYRIQGEDGMARFVLWDLQTDSLVWQGEGGLLRGFDPQWDSAGEAIVFTEDRTAERLGEGAAQSDLWLLTAAGEVRQLDSGVIDAFVRWSPEGRRLAYWRQARPDAPEPRGQLRIVDMETRENPRPLHCYEMLSVPLPQFAWGPGEESLFYVVQTESGTSIRLLDFQTGQEMTVYDGPGALVGWVPFVQDTTPVE